MSGCGLIDGMAASRLNGSPDAGRLAASDMRHLQVRQYRVYGESDGTREHAIVLAKRVFQI